MTFHGAVTTCTLCLGALWLTACGGGDSGGCGCTDPMPCNRVVVQGHPATASDASLTWRGVTMSILAPDGSELPDGTCSLKLAPINQDDLPPGPSLTELPRDVLGGCVLAGRRLSLHIDLGDIRALDNGTSTVKVGGWATPPSSMDTECTISSTATLVVSGASGGSLPFPELVTGDFSRTLELSLGNAAGTCLLEGSLRFTVSAADYEGIADTTCRICGC